jgi:multidrug transporter EmrE-like cation transporter
MIINSFLWVVIAVLCNVLAQTSLKKASALLVDATNTWIFNSSGVILVLFGIICYSIAFFLTLKIYKSNELSVITPVMMGMIFIFTLIISLLIFNEPVTTKKIAGSFFIFIGVLIVSIK